MATNTNRKKAKADDSTDALRRRKERREKRGNSATADWESANPELLIRLIGCVTALKGTITFGYTRDGGAYYVNYYVGGESEKEYVRPTEDLDKWLQVEVDSWD